MSLLTLLVIIFGIYNILHLSANQITQDILSIVNKEKTISKKALLAQGKVKPSKLEKAIREIEYALEITNKQHMFSTICFISIMLFVSGIIFAVLIGNYVLMPIFAVGFSLIPYAYTKSTVSAFNKHTKEELETSLSVITSSYIRTDNLIFAVQENIDNLKQPVKGIFKDFLGQSKLINSNMGMAIQNLRDKIDNSIFHEWCDILMACQEDHTLKETLYPVTEKLTDVRIINGELEVLTAKPKNEFIGVIFLVYAIIPLLYFLNKEWFFVLFKTIQGKISFGITMFVTFISILKVIKHTRPIEYKK